MGCGTDLRSIELEAKLLSRGMASSFVVALVPFLVSILKTTRSSPVGSTTT
jgi:hypothetical protein